MAGLRCIVTGCYPAAPEPAALVAVAWRPVLAGGGFVGWLFEPETKKPRECEASEIPRRDVWSRAVYGIGQPVGRLSNSPRGHDAQPGCGLIVIDRPGVRNICVTRVKSQRMNAPRTTAQRVRKSEASLIERGGRRMPSGMLQPDAAQALADLVAAGYAASPVAVISAALLDAQRKIRRNPTNGIK